MPNGIVAPVDLWVHASLENPHHRGIVRVGSWIDLDDGCGLPTGTPAAFSSTAFAPGSASEADPSLWRRRHGVGFFWGGLGIAGLAQVLGIACEGREGDSSVRRNDDLLYVIPVLPTSLVIPVHAGITG